MHNDLIETLYAYWRRFRDVVQGLLPRPEPVPMPIASPDRAELFEQLRELRARRALEAEQHQIEADALTCQWREMQTAADEIQHQINRLQHADVCLSLDHSAAEDRLLAQITEKSSMSLRVFIEEMDTELDSLNHTEAVVLPSAHRDYSLVKKVMGLETDDPSRKRRAAALHAARARACAMQSELLSIEQMNAELLRLRRTIPEVTNEVLHNERASIVAYN